MISILDFGVANNPPIILRKTPGQYQLAIWGLLKHICGGDGMRSIHDIRANSYHRKIAMLILCIV